MNVYRPTTPRTALGLAAVAMTTITMGLLVVLPATVDSVKADTYVLGEAMRAPIEDAISPARIDVREIFIRKEHVQLDCVTQVAQGSPKRGD
jgi:hypothetical protein